MQNLMLILYFPYGFFITMLYGDVIGFGWGCMALAFLIAYLEDKKIWQIVCCCISLILAVIFKQNEMILFVGIIILLTMDLLPGKDKNSGKRMKTGTGVVVLLAFIFFSFVGFEIPNMIIGHMSGARVEGGNSRWAHVAMGLQESEKAPGWYNNYVDEVFAENGYDKEETAKAAKAAVKERMHEFEADPYGAWVFFHKKLASVWNNPSFECFHIQNSRYTGTELTPVVRSVINDGGKLNLLLIELLDLLQTVVLFGVLMYLICGKTTDIRKLLCLILFIGGFLFSVFWEAKCRYVIPFYLLLIPYAYPGYMMIRQKRWIKAAVCVSALIVVIGIWHHPWVDSAFKLWQDTDAYYDYIHEYDHNFEWFRF